jgi:saccharopine dehydrogenase-like NADP-dependent oxidoreductase
MEANRIVLLGYGMQGQAALYDLVRQDKVSQVVVADSRPDLTELLQTYPQDKVIGHVLDADDQDALSGLIEGASLVVEALPARFSLPVACLAASHGVHLVTSMFFFDASERDHERIQTLQKEMEELDRQARESRATILYEFGLDPGIDLVLAARAVSEFDQLRELHSYGAGLPVPGDAGNPLGYKFSWWVLGTLWSYRRPATVITGGKVKQIDKNELFEPHNTHNLEIAGIESPLECYPSGDCLQYAERLGIRDSVVEMGRYSCRYPGHCAFWRTAVKSGFLNLSPIQVDGNHVSPLLFTAALLDGQEQFHFLGGERDLTLIRVDARGIKGGAERRVVYQVIDRRDLETGFTSMQRTVGFTMALGARLILSGQLDKPGLVSPMEVPYDLVVEGLQRHGIRITREEYQ